MADTTPLHATTGIERARLTALAERFEFDPRRPCCDGQTTMADWLNSDMPAAKLDAVIAEVERKFRDY